MEKKDFTDAVAEPTQKKEPKAEKVQEPEAEAHSRKTLELWHSRENCLRLQGFQGSVCLGGECGPPRGGEEGNSLRQGCLETRSGPVTWDFPPEFRPRVPPLFTLRKHLQGKL